ncbi:MAG: hypothetical protein M3022_18865, partial [Actinomycetota bacterium]|nr:hypothetical protein [Actinomycetota bacterium]
TCWPVVPFSSGDVSYFNSLENRLNAVITSAAQSNAATYVDTYTSSIGHDACKAPGTAWVNGIIRPPPPIRCTPTRPASPTWQPRSWRICRDAAMTPPRAPISVKDEHGT